jgi:hypothetical protein
VDRGNIDARTARRTNQRRALDGGEADLVWKEFQLNI